MNALTALKNMTGQYITPITGDIATHTIVIRHPCSYMTLSLWTNNKPAMIDAMQYDTTIFENGSSDFISQKPRTKAPTMKTMSRNAFALLGL